MTHDKPVDEKAIRVAAEAADVFLRYGFTRTTMGDIAAAAGISRPSLYLLFPGKEDIFSAATMHMAANGMREIRAAVEQCAGLEAKLSTGCANLLGRVFALQEQSPDAKDMDDFRFPVVRAIYQMFEDYFASLIADAGIASTQSPQRIARVLLFGARGLRNVAADAEDFAALIRLHVHLVYGGMNASAARG